MNSASLPFPRGQTFFNGGTTNTTDGLNLEGMEVIVRDTIYGSGRPVRLKCVRNVSGVTLYPKTLVRYQLTADNFGKRVDGYTKTTGQDWAGVVDELVTSVPANDLFWIVVEGPAIVRRSLANYSSDIAVGDRVVAQTINGTTGSTTTGRIDAQPASSTALTSDLVQNVVGRALSTIVTNATTVDPLILVGRR